MKNVKLLFFFLFFLTSDIAFSQTLGIKAGVLNNDIHVKIPSPASGIIQTVHPEYSVGFLVGGMFKKTFNPRFALKAELSYMQKGANKFLGVNENSKLHYLEFSALTMVQVIKNGTIDFGIEPGLLLDSPFEQFTEKFDVGLIGGASYLVKDKVEFSVRYFYGLSPVVTTILTDDDGNNSGTLDYFNRNFQVSVGYYLL